MAWLAEARHPKSQCVQRNACGAVYALSILDGKTQTKTNAPTWYGTALLTWFSKLWYAAVASCACYFVPIREEKKFEVVLDPLSKKGEKLELSDKSSGSETVWLDQLDIHYFTFSALAFVNFIQWDRDYKIKKINK